MCIYYACRQAFVFITVFKKKSMFIAMPQQSSQMTDCVTIQI